MAMDNPYRAILIALVDLLKEQGREDAGVIEGLNPYQALLEVKSQAELAGVPLEEIGLADFDIDSILNPKRSAA